MLSLYNSRYECTETEYKNDCTIPKECLTKNGYDQSKKKNC